MTFISKTSLDIVAVHSHNIAVSDFVEIAEKLEIEKAKIKKDDEKEIEKENEMIELLKKFQYMIHLTTHS